MRLSAFSLSRLRQIGLTETVGKSRQNISDCLCHHVTSNYLVNPCWLSSRPLLSDQLTRVGQSIDLGRLLRKYGINASILPGFAESYEPNASNGVDAWHFPRRKYCPEPKVAAKLNCFAATCLLIRSQFIGISQ